jgi:riboflavin synthase
MFTGLVETTGKFHSFEKKGKQWRLLISPPKNKFSVKISDSISVNGICLTVASQNSKSICFDVLNETYDKTGLKFLKPGASVNLERSLKIGDRLGGHFVTGHIDGIGEIVKISKTGKEKNLVIRSRENLSPYLAYKGSIAIDGISLTVGPVYKNSFEVFLIPYTLEHTNLGERKTGDCINLEVDILARYAKGEKLQKNCGITLSFLKKHGFCR